MNSNKNVTAHFVEGCTSPPVSEVGAIAYTYHLTMSKIQSKIDKLIETGDIHRSYPLVEPKRTTKADVVYEIYVEWAEYTGADGYKVYRSVNGGSYTLIAEGNVDPGYGYYSFWDASVSAGSTYSYYVTAYGTGWETCASQSASTTPLPSCSLISPTNGTTISNPNPVFSWSPVGVSSYPYGAIYSGESDLYVYDETASSTSWWTYFTNMTTSSATYNQDGQATDLVSGHNYTWNSWAYGYNGSGKGIAMSWSEDWGFIYDDGGYNLTTSVTPTGSGSVTLSPSGGIYVPGTVVTLTANPNTNYEFDYWSGDASGTSPSTTVTMSSNKSVTAHFKGTDYTLTTSVTPTGSGSVTLSPSGGIYVPGTVVTLTANPATGYEFDHWGGDASGTATSVTITMNSHKNVTAYFVPVQYNLTTSVSPSGSGYVTPSSGTYNAGTSVTITAHAYSGYEFDHWGGDASGTATSVTITMNSHKNVTAYFVLEQQYNLTTSVSPSGSGYVTPSSGTYNAGTSVTITAHAYSGYEFDHWGGDASGTATSVTITMNSHKNVTAYFVLEQQYNLTTSVSPSGSGYVTPSSGTYNAGTSVTITAHAYSGYEFDHWGGDASGTATSVTITMNSHKNVTAYFVPVQYNLTTSVSPSGSGYVTPSSGTYNAGTSVTITAHAYSGYEFDHWGGDASGTATSVTITMNSHKNVTAYFVPVQYNLTTSVSPSGSGYVTPSSGTYNAGTSVTITAHAYSGYEFDHWGGDASGTATSVTITMNSHKSITAYFLENEVTYRALGAAIDNYDYSGFDDLCASVSDARSIETIFDYCRFGSSNIDFYWNYLLENQSAFKDNIEYYLSYFAGVADDNDVTYFHFHGHGSESYGEYYLLPVDCGGYSDTAISLNELEGWLDQIPGYKVVILSSCRSGGFIGRNNFSSDFDPVEFNEAVINVFSNSFDKNLAKSKYYVLTACSGVQESVQWCPPIGAKFSYFIAHLRAGCGYPDCYYPCPANTDSNPAVSLHEAYTYVKDNVPNWMPVVDQDVQIYPWGSDFTIVEY